MYLLDTCTVSDFIKGDKNTLTKLKSISPSKLYISSLTVMELYYGLNLNLSIKQKIEPIIIDFINSVHVLPYNREDALTSANIRSSLKIIGTPIGAYDLLIAATCINNNLTLVTSNVKEFTRINELLIENWRLE
jgi:tRNA(fMet)-specific endonuclease VapC